MRGGQCMGGEGRGGRGGEEGEGGEEEEDWICERRRLGIKAGITILPICTELLYINPFGLVAVGDLYTSSKGLIRSCASARSTQPSSLRVLIIWR